MTAVRLEDLEEVESESAPSLFAHEVAAGAEWNPVEDVMLRRRSIRKYRRRQVPAHLIRRMLEVGRYAPSQGNCQPWKFVVVRDAEMIQEMEDYCAETCKKLSAGFVVFPSGFLWGTHHESPYEPWSSYLLTRIAI